MKKGICIISILLVLTFISSCTEPGINSEKVITSFIFTTAANNSLTTDVNAVINGTEISASVSAETDVTDLVAVFSTTGSSVVVGTVVQSSGITTNDFSDPVSYTVIAEDGSSQNYQVVVAVDPASPNSNSEFITRWDMSQTTTNTLLFPLEENGVYDFSIDWGDATIENITTVPIEHVYAAEGVYTVKINGICEGFGFPYGLFTEHPNRENLVDVMQWGSVKFHNRGFQLRACKNLMNFTATDTPDLSGITNFNFFFQSCSVFNDDLSAWVTTGAVNMRDCFGAATIFDGDVSTWDTSSVTNMKNMFREAHAFNCNISQWKTGKVTDMEGMFCNAEAFNANISGWNTESVENMKDLFYNAESFDQDLPNWKTGKVTTMEGMFSRTEKFNGNISGWTTTSVESMKGMFLRATAFNIDISGWEFPALTTIDSMFGYTESFNQDLSNWTVSGISDMSSLFYNALVYNNNDNPSGLESWQLANDCEKTQMFTGSLITTDLRPSWW